MSIYQTRKSVIGSLATAAGIFVVLFLVAQFGAQSLRNCLIPFEPSI